MRNLLNKKLKNEKGLTLIELLAVIVILAIIALIAIPAIGNIISNSKSKAILSDATTIVAGAKTAIADGACTASGTTATCTADQLKDYVEGLKVAMNDGATTGDQVVKSGDTYTITYAPLSTLNEKYTKILTKAQDGKESTTAIKTASNKAIAKAMGGE
ncbi:MAG: prepilin-type N-terminal cleavage/methylation domain-containing protein [Kurthia gibsonii]|uniref:Prepilin-type N-terminal cleavage/methylation domain-containing protein n=1 Tax=Kurthia gibsonii TaxID=33946 RepID=A0ABU9LKF2_9BACL|nr:prepilin-type N-terminal cleavage/methylation domain-containing protein [Kurthia gibsonii]